jgi:hypothetical protein
VRDAARQRGFSQGDATDLPVSAHERRDAGIREALGAVDRIVPRLRRSSSILPGLTDALDAGPRQMFSGRVSFGLHHRGIPFVASFAPRLVLGD